MTMPGSIPSVDVTEAGRRLREDPARPVLLDVRELERVRRGPRAGRRARPDVGLRGPPR